MKKHRSLLCPILLLTLLTSCQNGLTMSAEEFLRSNAQTKDKNIQTSSFSSSYVLNDDALPFDELKDKVKTIGSYLYTTEADEEGQYHYIPRLNKEKAFVSEKAQALSTFKISALSNSQAYIDSDNKTLYDSMGNSFVMTDLPDTSSSQEYTIVIAGDTELYEAMLGEKTTSALHIFNLAYINSSSSETLAILFKNFGDTEYLIPHTSLISYVDKLANLRQSLGTSFSLNEDGTYQTSSEVYYYDSNVVFSHVAKKNLDKDLVIDATNVKGDIIFSMDFVNGASILYSYEIINSISNDFDFIKDDMRYKVHVYHNKGDNAKYNEVNKFPIFYFEDIVHSKDGNKCAVLCHQINKDKTISADYSTIAFSNEYKFGKFASELGIFTKEESYIRFGEEYYSYKSDDYDLYMYRTDDFAILKAQDETKLDHKYLAINNQSKSKKIFATHFSSLSTEHHAVFYSINDSVNLQFNILDTETLETTVIQDSEKKHIASLEYGLYWEITETQQLLKDFMGNVIIGGDNLNAEYFYELSVSREYWIQGSAYKFYTFYGSETYSSTTSGVSFNSVYYLANKWK